MSDDASSGDLQANDSLGAQSPGGIPPELEARFVQHLTGAQQELQAYIRCLLGPGPDVDDVLQETNSDIWRRRADFDVERPFLPWAFGFAFQRVRAFRTSKARSKLLFSDEVMESVADEFNRLSVRSTQFVHLKHCLQRLPQAHAQLITQRYEAGQSVKRLADDMRKTPNSVANLLYRIRARLLACMRHQMALEPES